MMNTERTTAEVCKGPITYTGTVFRDAVLSPFVGGALSNKKLKKAFQAVMICS